MKLLYKLLITTLVPVILLSAVTAFQIQKLMDKLKTNMEYSYTLEAEKAKEKLNSLIDHHVYVAKVLASSKGFVEAIEKADNDYLSNQAKIFIDDRIGKVTFTDMKGIVLARAHDEFRFGDQLNKRFFHMNTIARGSYQGVALIDGDDSLTYAKVVKKYGEIPIGVISLSVTIDKNLLKYINKGVSGTIQYTSENKNISNGEIRNGISKISIGNVSGLNEVIGVCFVIKDIEKKSYYDLLRLQKQVIYGIVFLVILLSIVMFIMIKYHLKPYKMVVDDLISFKSDIPSFKEKLKKVNTDKNHEIQQVIKGLLGMTSIIEKNIQLLREKNSELETISKTDRLTGVSNRMHLDNVLASELSRSKRYDNRLSLIMLDIDHFKKINDTYGHQVGDKVLIQLSEILKINTRDTDTVGRWGGEEFMIVCPEISQDQAFVIAEKILTILNQSKICDISVTASFGISQLRDEDSVEQLVKRADENLYKAKHSGRNCIFPKLKIL